MATGSDVLTAMALSDTNKTQAAPNLAAVNFGIYCSWPMWRMTEFAAGGTLTDGTYVYSLSALTTIEQDAGIASVTVTPTNSYPRDVSHRCRQYYDFSASAWSLEISPDVVSKYATYPFSVHYQYRHPRLTVITGTVYAPVDALAQSALLWMAMYGATEQNLDNAFWKAFAPEYLRAATPIWERVRNQHLSHRVTLGKGHI